MGFVPFPVFVAVLAVTTTASGRASHVDRDGTPGVDCDCTEIQAFIDSAAADDTVQVAAVSRASQGF